MTTLVHFVFAVTTLLALSSVSRAQDIFETITKNDAERLAKILKDDPKLANIAKGGELPLHRALGGNEVKIVELLLAAGADVNATDANGGNAAHYAAGNRNKAMLILVIARGANSDAPANNGFTPLFSAARDGIRQNVALLLEKGANPDGGFDPKKANPPHTPLYEAVCHGRLGTAELLLAKGANPNAKGVQASPLDKAAERRDRNMMCLLLTHGAKVHSDAAFSQVLRAGDRELAELFLKSGLDAKKIDYLHEAAWGSKKMVELLLDHGANPRALDEQKQNVLWSAVRHGDAAIVALLLARGADAKNVDQETTTPLHHVANATVAELLLASGADVNATAKDGATPMRNALHRGDKELVETLAKRGATLDASSLAALGRAEELRKLLQKEPLAKPTKENGFTALHLAALFGQKETIAVLLDKGADVNSKTADGRTPLHLAAQNGHTAAVEFLLKKNADINAKASGLSFSSRPPQLTPLNFALDQGHVAVVRLLVAKGATPKLEGAFEQAYWNLAADRKDLAMLRYFLERGLPVDAELGRTPISLVRLAAERGDLEALKAFVVNGADLKKKSPTGDTPLRAAVRGKSKAVVEYLLDHGADVSDPVPLLFAVHQGDKAIVELLLNKGAAIHSVTENVNETSNLRSAVDGNQHDMLKLLLVRGADVKKDPLILHTAALQGRKAFIETLLNSGADLEGAGGQGMGSHLYWRWYHERMDVMDFFQSATVPGIHAGTPLQAAVAGKQSEAVTLLLAKGAKIDTKLPSGAPVLHLAAYLGDVETAKVLLANKVGVTAKDAAGLTALKVSEREGRKEMAALLRKMGAKE